MLGFPRRSARKVRSKPDSSQISPCLSDDYFSVPGEAIQDITSVLTLVGGKAVYGDGGLQRLGPATATRDA